MLKRVQRGGAKETVGGVLFQGVDDAAISLAFFNVAAASTAPRFSDFSSCSHRFKRAVRLPGSDLDQPGIGQQQHNRRRPIPTLQRTGSRRRRARASMSSASRLSRTNSA